MSFHCKSAGVIETVIADLTKSNVPAGLKADLLAILNGSKRGCAYIEVHGHNFNEGGNVGKCILETFDASGVTELRDKLIATTANMEKIAALQKHDEEDAQRLAEQLNEATTNLGLREGELKDALAKIEDLQRQVRQVADMAGEARLADQNATKPTAAPAAEAPPAGSVSQ